MLVKGLPDCISINIYNGKNELIEELFCPLLKYNDERSSRVGVRNDIKAIETEAGQGPFRLEVASEEGVVLWTCKSVGVSLSPKDKLTIGFGSTPMIELH